MQFIQRTKWLVLAISVGAFSLAVVFFMLVETAVPHFRLGEHRGVASMSFSPDGTRLASCSVDPRAYIWDLATRQKRQLTQSGEWCSIAFSPDGADVAVGSNHQTIDVYNSSSFQQTDHLHRKGESHNMCLQYLRDGRTLVNGSGINDSVVRFWDLDSGAVIKQLDGHGGGVYCLAVSSDGKSMATAGEDNTVIVWNLDEGNVIHTLQGHSGSVNSVAFSASGNILASGGVDGRVCVWNAKSGSQQKTLIYSQEPVNSVVFSATERYLISAAGGSVHKPGGLLIWDITSERLVLL